MVLLLRSTITRLTLAGGIEAYGVCEAKNGQTIEVPLRELFEPTVGDYYELMFTNLGKDPGREEKFVTVQVPF